MPVIPATDDFVAPFQIEGQPVRGRIVRLGATVDEILTRHDYPEPVADLLGEACALAALVGSSLKFDGRLVVQASGNGPVSLVVVDYDTKGGLRGYCAFDAEKVAAASRGFIRPGAKTLLGKGIFTMTIDQGPDMDRYQGITAIEGETLALCAEQYFMNSEQIPTRVRLAVGQVDDGKTRTWRAGGLMLQYVAADDARGSTSDAWDTAQALFITIGEDELVDPMLPGETLLWRLFHEDGVRLFAATPVTPFCRCSRERIVTMLRAFTPDEREDMVEGDGHIRVTCEYCSRTYAVAPHMVDD